MPKATGEGAGAAIGGVAGTIFGGPMGGAVGASLGGAVGSMFGGGQTQRELENYTRMKTLLGKGSKRARKQYFGAAERLTKRGYNQAEQALEGIGAAERQSILDDRTRQMASMDQRMASRGLYNTSVGVGAGQEYQGIQYQTQQSLSDLQSRLAGLYSNLYTSRGSELAGLKTARYQARQGDVAALGSFFAGQPIHQPASIDYGGLLELGKAAGDVEWSNPFG
jgi:hypothetical protein